MPGRLGTSSSTQVQVKVGPRDKSNIATIAVVDPYQGWSLSTKMGFAQSAPDRGTLLAEVAGRWGGGAVMLWWGFFFV